MLVWDDNRVTVGSTTFQYSLFTELTSTAERFIIWKTPAMIDRLAALIDEVAPARIVELGVAQGGSAVLMTELCHPSKLVTFDRRDRSEAPEALYEYIEANALADRLIPVYGVDQADVGAIRVALDREFGDQLVDLVIDDASHQLAESRASFNEIFPRVRPGGVYLIEDWTWGHKGVSPKTPEELEFARRAFWPSGPPLSVLAFEILMAFATVDGLIAGVDVDETTIRVWRGPAPLPAGPFDIAAIADPGGIRILTDDT